MQQKVARLDELVEVVNVVDGVIKVGVLVLGVDGHVVQWGPETKRYQVKVITVYVRVLL